MSETRRSGSLPMTWAIKKAIDSEKVVGNSRNSCKHVLANSHIDQHNQLSGTVFLEDNLRWILRSLKEELRL